MKEISVLELNELMKDGSINLIDVRSKEEFDEVHAKSVILKELTAIETWIHDLNKDEKYYFICKSGGRSGIACKYLEKHGFSDVTNVLGGTTAWVDSGLDCE
jgi:rhodanese-related sulfurtransferase